MARCNCGILPLITIDPNSALTMTGTGTPGDPLILGNNPAAMGWVTYQVAGADTWDKADYPGVKFVRVRVVGGGGGSAGATGGATTGIARGGGGGGAYTESWIDVATLPASVAITVGAGGTAGTAATAGGNGGQSSFGGVFADGGTGSGIAVAVATNYVVAPGGAGGAAGNGQLFTPGEAGNHGVQFTSAQRQSGAGGHAAGGLGVGARSVTDLAAGVSASATFGGGASGAAAYNNAFAGAAGGRGVVLVEMFR